ncbi:hypothetical protein ACN47E_008780 [Coniothyrium glycines]
MSREKAMAANNNVTSSATKSTGSSSHIAICRYDVACNIALAVPAPHKARFTSCASRSVYRKTCINC